MKYPIPGIDYLQHNTLFCPMEYNVYCPSSMISLKNVSSFYWKWPATSPGLLFNKLHRCCWRNFFSCSSLSLTLFNLLIKCGSSSHLRSASDSARKYAGIPNCLTIANTSYKNRLQYSGAPWTQLIKENALSLATNFPIVPLKLFLTVSAMKVLNLVLRIAKFISAAAHTQTWQ